MIRETHTHTLEVFEDERGQTQDLSFGINSILLSPGLSRSLIGTQRNWVQVFCLLVYSGLGGVTVIILMRTVEPISFSLSRANPSYLMDLVIQVSHSYSFCVLLTLKKKNHWLLPGVLTRLMTSHA